MRRYYFSYNENSCLLCGDMRAASILINSGGGEFSVQHSNFCHRRMRSVWGDNDRSDNDRVDEWQLLLQQQQQLLITCDTVHWCHVIISCWLERASESSFVCLLPVPSVIISAWYISRAALTPRVHVNLSFSSSNRAQTCWLCFQCFVAFHIIKL